MCSSVCVCALCMLLQQAQTEGSWNWELGTWNCNFDHAESNDHLWILGARELGAAFKEDQESWQSLVERNKNEHQILD